MSFSTSIPGRILGACFVTALIGSSALAQAPSRVTVPRDIGQERMRARRAQQESSAGAIEVFRGFGFTDRVEPSGITFRSRIVDDVGRDYKMVHYDHGNGLVAADVDGDGRIDLYFLTQAGENQLWRTWAVGDSRTSRPLPGSAWRIGSASPRRSRTSTTTATPTSSSPP